MVAKIYNDNKQSKRLRYFFRVYSSTCINPEMNIRLLKHHHPLPQFNGPHSINFVFFR